MNERPKLLQDREKSYGNFAEQGAFAQRIKNLMRTAKGWDKLELGQQEAMDFIATKTSRILFGDPHHQDSWKDIGGYAELGREIASDEIPF